MFFLDLRSSSTSKAHSSRGSLNGSYLGGDEVYQVRRSSVEAMVAGGLRMPQRFNFVACDVFFFLKKMCFYKNKSGFCCHVW